MAGLRIPDVWERVAHIASFTGGHDGKTPPCAAILYSLTGGFAFASFGGNLCTLV